MSTIITLTSKEWGRGGGGEIQKILWRVCPPEYKGLIHTKLIVGQYAVPLLETIQIKWGKTYRKQQVHCYYNIHVISAQKWRHLGKCNKRAYDHEEWSQTNMLLHRFSSFFAFHSDVRTCIIHSSSLINFFSVTLFSFTWFDTWNVHFKLNEQCLFFFKSIYFIWFSLQYGRLLRVWQ